jgi:hypothetical protein
MIEEIPDRNIFILHFFDSIPDIFPGNDVGISYTQRKLAEKEGNPPSQLNQINNDIESRNF